MNWFWNLLWRHIILTIKIYNDRIDVVREGITKYSFDGDIGNISFVGTLTVSHNISILIGILFKQDYELK